MKPIRLIFILFTVTLLIVSAILINNRSHVGFVDNMLPSKNHAITIVIDPGHGGYDPGKVNTSANILEKDINLAISLCLSSILEGLHYNVVMTRTDDSDLCPADSHARKTDDLDNRIGIAEENSADYLISIHQNSFGDPSVHGAQMFYYSEGPSKDLACAIQTAVNPERTAKSDKSYYMLRKTKCPAVIVECGFLSNPNEAGLLRSEEYQKQIATLIAQGIDDYISSH